MDPLTIRKHMILGKEEAMKPLTIRKHMTLEDQAIFLPFIVKLDDYMQHPSTLVQGGVFPDALDYWLRFKNLVLDGNENIAGRH